MDIASLLSDDSAPRNGSSSNQNQTQPKKRQRPVSGSRTTSLLSQEVLISPSPEPPRSAASNGISGDQQASSHNNTSTSGAYAHGDSRAGSVIGTPVPDVATLPNAAHRPSLTGQHRHSSTSQVDIQTAQSLSPAQRPDLNATRSPSIPNARHLAPPNVRTHSASDLVMAEAPAQTPPPRNFSASSISDADIKAINELTSYLAEHSYDYNSHVQLINLLHKGFVAHVNAPPDDAMIPPKPSDYTLLKDLRMARGAMDSRYSVGEDIWRDWINDESMLAHSSEERQAVMELCVKAVQEEPASVVLWSLYGEWVWSTYAVANGFMEGDEDSWTEEDKMICKEVFTREMVLLVWSQAVEVTKWRMDESHVVWSRYVELIMQDFLEQPSPQMIEDVQGLYMARLQTPHAAWESTSQSFWPFISKYKADSWEEIMSATNELAGPAKREYAIRESHELELTKAFRSNDSVALYNAFASYMAWEVKHLVKKKGGPFDVEIRCGLFERALLRLPTMIDWWLDYVDFLVSLDSNSPNILPLLERATRHCPWSGELWARRLLRVELESKSYDEVESVKHKATNSGLLPTGGIEEILIVYSAWCSYLRRRAFEPTASDDDVDMADMAISGVLTDIQYDGKKTYGEDFKGDPRWRIEKIFVKFLTQARRINEAREFWRSLIPAQGYSYDFWAQYYEWEIFVWGAERTILNLRDQTAENSPHRASAVLREAMAQKDLDWPEKIYELYAHHFQTHEMAAEIQQAQVDLRAAQKHLRIRREKEAAAAAEAQAQEQAYTASVDDSNANAKRKREDEPMTNGEASVKRNKVQDPAASEERTETSSSAAAQIKRDREHNTITVKNLPASITEKRVRQFFADCGTIPSVNILVDENKQAATATIEFETHDDVLSAKTKDGKSIDDHEIRIQSGTLSTLYVTNYPASFAEDEIRDLFSSYGTIVSIRFPSLKYNQRRRFCYVQFLTTQEARNATELNDKIIDAQHKLVVLISDPDAKKGRKGATSEGRELYVGNVEHGATESEIRTFFEQSGKVESVRMIKAANGRFTGTAFVVYATPDEAQSALSFNNKALQTRLLRVTLATDKSTRDAANKKPGSTKVFETAKSASPAPSSDQGTTNDDGNTAASPSAGPSSEQTDTSRTKHERTVALLGLPDTVNDTRVHDFFARFGPIRKLTVRRDKGGAMVEFVNIEDAGKVGMGVDASALGPECRVGEVVELLHGKKRKTKDVAAGNGGAGGSAGSAAGESSKAGGAAAGGAAKLFRPTQVSRPGQKLGSRGRGGRKVGVGFRGGKPGGGSGAAEVQGDGAKKSNSDFRDMFLASSGAGAKQQGGEGAQGQ